MCLWALLLPFLSPSFAQPPDPSQIPEPQIAYALHAVWDPDLTDNLPPICTTSGTVAVPWFHFYAGWKDGAPAFFSVDWVKIEELTNDHTPQVWYFENPQGSSGFPDGCTMPPVSDPENWNWTTWSFAPMIGFAMHNTAYKVTVQWQYSVYMKGPRGPFQTSITINVQNLVVTSPDETKVLKWDPLREIAETSFSYNLECAQRKWCQVLVSIYRTDGVKVYEEWLEQLAPGSYSFVWDGSVNVVPPSPLPDGLAPAGLYIFDIDVIGIAPGYDEDKLKSTALSIEEHQIEPIAPEVYQAQYILRSNRDASQVWIEVYDPMLERIVDPIEGPVHAIPDGIDPSDTDWNYVRIDVNLEYASNQPYRFIFAARDSFHDYDKAHRNKVCLLNQAIWNLGWALSCGFLYPKSPGYPWSRFSPNSLDTRDTANYVSRVVKFVVIPTGFKTTLIGAYHRKIKIFGSLEDLLYTFDGGADTFVDKLNKAIQARGWGLIHWAGHGADGRVIAFPDNNPTDPIYLFGIGKLWNGWKCKDINDFPQGSFINVKVVYLGGCRTCTDENGGGLPQAFVNKGAHAAVGWHVYRKSLLKENTEPDKIFWASLTGHCTWYKVGSTVEEAAHAAVVAYMSFWSWLNGYHIRQYVGIAGNRRERLY